MYLPLEIRRAGRDDKIGIRIGHTRLLYNTESEAVAGIDALISLCQASLPLLPARVVIGRLERATVDKCKVGSSLTNERLLSSVLEVGTDTWQIDHNGNAERLEFILGPNSTELENLGS